MAVPLLLRLHILRAADATPAKSSSRCNHSKVAPQIALARERLGTSLISHSDHLPTMNVEGDNITFSEIRPVGLG